MLRPFGLTVVISNAMLARVAIVDPILIITLSTLAVQISISARYHSRKSTERRLRYQVALKEVDVSAYNTNLQKPGAGQGRHCTKSDEPSSSPASLLPGLP